MRHSLRTRSLRALAALACAALPACSGDGGPNPVPPLSVTATGRMERGSILTVAATADGLAVPAASLALTSQPADAVQALGDGTVKLLKAGKVSIVGSYDGRVGTVEVTVAAPPVVVFERFTANRDVWKVDLDGQNLTQLTTDPGEDQAPTVAGSTVVFVSFRAGNADLYSIPLAGGATTRLTTTTKDETTPALSRDGSKLAFSYIPSDVSKLFTAAPTGAGAAQATPTSGADVIETWPSWNPNGSALAYVSTVNGTADIFTLSPGGTPAALVTGPSADVEPAWSPDGSKLAFVSNRAGGTQVFLYSPNGGQVTQLTTGTERKSQPTWTPDGRIVYTETIVTSGAPSTTALRWIDPAAPGTTYLIPTGTGTVGHPAVAAAP